MGETPFAEHNQSPLAPRYSMTEFAERGEARLRVLQPGLDTTASGQFIAIDIETGMYETDHDDYEAARKLRARCPDAQIWMGRVGERTAYRMGGGRRQVTP